MDNNNLHIFKLITANIDLITQVNQHFEETQVLFRGGDISFKYVKRFYKLAALHYAQTEKRLLLLKSLGEVTPLTDRNLFEEIFFHNNP